MILNHQQIKDIILNNPNRKLVSEGSQYNKKMRRHLYGVDLAGKLSKIDGFESQSLSELKVKYARSNKDLFARLARPIDKVFSARGGSVYYNLPDEQDKQARRLIQDVRKGYSIRKWVEMFWKPHLLDDPYGLVFMEILPAQEAILARQQGRSFVYPTYKSINSIYDYLPAGSSCEYVVFNVENDEKLRAGITTDKTIYRVVDDAWDYWVERVDQDIKIIDDHSYPNYFGQVPAQINSDIVSPECEDRFLSFFDDVIELADEFLTKGAIKTTHEFMHAYPKYWQYAEGCNHCSGTGLSSREEDGKCKPCGGTGKKMMLKVSDVMLLDMPESGDQKITPEVAGYVSPDKTFFEIATTGLKLLEDLMNMTVWGHKPKSAVAGPQVGKDGHAKTATQVMDEVKPQADRLQVVSEMAEKRHKFILDAVIRLNLSIPNYIGSSVNYGRRYMIEGPDDIWKKYSEARQQGAPVSVLEDLLIEYYEAKYTSDPIALAVALKLMYVEPFLHHTVEQVKALGVSDEDWKAKLYFSEWESTMSEMDIVISDADTLRLNLKQFVSGVKLPAPPEQKQLAA
jgi:hypothetical protein